MPVECAVTRVASTSMTTGSVLDRGAGVIARPVPAPRARAALIAASGVVGVRGQAGDQPGHRRVRGDRAEHPGLGAQHRDIAGGVPAERDRDRQIGHDLPRIMRRERQPPRPEQPRQPRARPLRRAVSTSNTPPACDTNDSPPAITDNQGRKSLCFTRGVPLSSIRCGSLIVIRTLGGAVARVGA